MKFKKCIQRFKKKKVSKVDYLCDTCIVNPVVCSHSVYKVTKCIYYIKDNKKIS
jgi:hypothetical protein